MGCDASFDSASAVNATGCNELWSNMSCVTLLLTSRQVTSKASSVLDGPFVQISTTHRSSTRWHSRIWGTTHGTTCTVLMARRIDSTCAKLDCELPEFVW